MVIFLGRVEQFRQFRGNYEEHFCDIILNLDQWFRRGLPLKDIHYLQYLLSPALEVFLFSGAEPFRQFW